MKINSKALIPIIILFVVAAFLAGTKFSKKPKEAVQPSDQQEAKTTDKPGVLTTDQINDLAKGGVVLGIQDSKITVVEFSDPSCPFCAIANGINVPDSFLQRNPGWEAPGVALEKLAKEGKIQLVFRYYPGHGSGEKAMMAAWCAEEQKEGVFWDFLGQLFENQNKIEDENTLWQIAKNLNLNSEEVKVCVESGKYKQRIQFDIKSAKEAAAQTGGGNGFGTPAFFVNGQQVVGAQSFSVFEKMIKEALQ